MQLGFNSSEININLQQTYEGNVHKPIVRKFDISVLSSIHEQDTITQVSLEFNTDGNTSAFTTLSDKEEPVEIRH